MQSVNADTIIDFTPELHAKGLQLISRYQTGGIYACDGGYSAFKGRLDVVEVFDRAEG